MSKKVVIISGSPRKNGNSDTLCNQFQRGCQDSGHQVSKITLRDKQIGFCRACYACRKTGECFQKDDAFYIMQEMCEADVIVLATPVYFYSISGQV